MLHRDVSLTAQKFTFCIKSKNFCESSLYVASEHLFCKLKGLIIFQDKRRHRSVSIELLSFVNRSYQNSVISVKLACFLIYPTQSQQTTSLLRGPLHAILLPHVSWHRGGKLDSAYVVKESFYTTKTSLKSPLRVIKSVFLLLAFILKTTTNQIIMLTTIFMDGEF